ncbi:uncharacterized protein K02A2.6-like [Panicum virgatum]|uniref:uncharacterized protein K02A2.6-like n=1 Tax=Panicum virgatum TaxID=38727 RepID=UPI0019D63DAB|nr:uncharacterized protein K02A2.6-like [Panicum virgatum]
MVGPLSRAPEGFTHLLVAVDKFTKWIEARPITTAKSVQATAFFRDIVHRFGVPNSIITDNGTNFTGKEFLKFCDDHHIRIDWAVLAHPRTNEQVERANGMVLQGLKPESSTGSKSSPAAILPTDLEYGSPRVKAYNEQGSDAALEDAMD